MKKVFWFMAIFTIVLIGFYMEPVFFPPSSTPISETPTSQSRTVSALGYEEIPAVGLSTYINRPQSDLEEEFGPALSTQETGFGYMVASYKDKIRNIFIEANIKDNVVQAIKVAGKATDRINPFHFGMNLTDLTEVTTLFANFSFDYNGEPIAIELSEEDMNYRPLIAFDNESFAILFFGQGNNLLYGITYMNKDSLMQLMPYQLDNGAVTTYQVADLSAEEWVATDQANALRGTNLVNYLRNLENLDSYLSSVELSATSSQLASQLAIAPESIIKEESLHQWTNIFPSSPVNQPVLLTKDAFLDGAIAARTVLAAKPVVDPTFTILKWYSEPFLHNRFTSNDEALAIAFSKENMVVLMQEEIEMKDSGN